MIKNKLSLAVAVALAGSSANSIFSINSVKTEFSVKQQLQNIMDNANTRGRKTGGRGFSQLPASVRAQRAEKRRRILNRYSLAKMCATEGKTLRA